MIETKRFLDEIMSGYDGPTFWEIRAYDYEDRPHPMNGRNFHTTQEQIFKFLQNNGINAFNVYLGVAPRIRESGNDADVEKLNLFWGDIDTYLTMEQINEIYRKLIDIGLTPSLVDSSGEFDGKHKCHIYWKLECLIGTEQWRKLEEALIKLMQKEFPNYNIDSSIKNPSRILRVVGTNNVGSKKKGRYDPPRPTKLLIEDYTTHRIKDFEAILKKVVPIDENLAQKTEQDENRKEVEDIEKLVEKIPKLRNMFEGHYEMYTNHDGVKFKSRNEAESSLITMLFMRGATEEQIRKIMPKCKIGKWIERPETYRKSVIEGAKKYVELHDLDKLTKTDNPLENVMHYELWRIAHNILIKSESKDPDEIKRKNEAIDKYGPDEIPFDSKKFNFDCANALLEMFHFKTTKDGEELFVYLPDRGIYVNSGEALIKAILTEKIGKYGTSHSKNEIINFVKHSTFIEGTMFNNNPTKQVLLNGVLDLETLQVSAFDPELVYTISLPVRYDPDAKCPKWEEFLSKKCESEDDRKTLQDYFGFCLLNDMRFEVALLLYGPKRSGKSTALLVLTYLLGEENCSHISLHLLNESRFMQANLFGKKANIFADLPSESLRSTSNFMTLTGRDPIEADVKNGKSIKFISMAKEVFSCNQIPRIPTKEEAFYRRWIILKFPYSLDKEDVDENFKTNLIKDELSGILNWALEGTKRILTNHSIHYAKSENEVKDVWNKNSDSISSFIFHKIDTDDDLAKERIRIIYKEYLDFCKAEEIRPENQWKFGRDFKMLTGCGTTRIDNIPAYAGIKLKDDKNRQKTLLGE